MTAPMVPAPEQPGVPRRATELLVAGAEGHTVLSFVQLSTGMWFSVVACAAGEVGEGVTEASRPRPIRDAESLCPACLLSPAGQWKVRAHQSQVIEAVVGQLRTLIGDRAAALRELLWRDLAEVGLGWEWHRIGPDGVLMEALRLLGGEPR